MSRVLACFCIHCCRQFRSVVDGRLLTAVHFSFVLGCKCSFCGKVTSVRVDPDGRVEIIDAEAVKYYTAVAYWVENEQPIVPQFAVKSVRDFWRLP